MTPDVENFSGPRKVGRPPNEAADRLRNKRFADPGRSAAGPDRKTRTSGDGMSLFLRREGQGGAWGLQPPAHIQSDRRRSLTAKAPVCSSAKHSRRRQARDRDGWIRTSRHRTGALLVIEFLAGNSCTEGSPVAIRPLLSHERSRAQIFARLWVSNRHQMDPEGRCDLDPNDEDSAEHGEENRAKADPRIDMGIIIREWDGLMAIMRAKTYALTLKDFKEKQETKRRSSRVESAQTHSTAHLWFLPDGSEAKQQRPAPRASVDGRDHCQTGRSGEDRSRQRSPGLKM
ncbi:hypothetical protein K438DRAFT_1749792 [Mycena galopus ATCC 62051]|nr:hypothetical protein K438DRAFT_1749792 [Mycena galopus ATCC 62051]